MVSYRWRHARVARFVRESRFPLPFPTMGRGKRRDALGARQLGHQLNDVITRPSGTLAQCNAQKRLFSAFGTHHLKTVAAKSEASPELEEDAAPLSFTFKMIFKRRIGLRIALIETEDAKWRIPRSP